MRWFFLLLVLALLIATFLLLPQSLKYVVNGPTEDTKSVDLFEVAQTDSILFTGDIMLGRHVETLARKHHSSYSFDYFPELISTSSVIFANFESSMSNPHKQTPSGGFTFSTDNFFPTVLASSGVTHVSLANNHALDYGVSGYNKTKNSLAAVGVMAFGHPTLVSSTSVTYTIVNEVRVGVLALHTLFNDPDVNDLQNVIAQMKQSSDLQFVYVHWGVEYEPIHSIKQKKLASYLVSQGIDAIIGHHPHVVQDIELIENVPVFYSLGNTIFDQYFSKSVQIGYLLRVTPSKSKLVFSLVPIQSLTAISQPHLMQGSERTDFLNSMALVSDESLQDSVKDGYFEVEL